MKKTLNGVVTSVAMTNTAVVEVFRRFPHPMYKKLLTRSKKFKVETAGIELAIGDTVKIVEIIPLSKTKVFKVQEVIKRVKEAKHE